MGFLSFANDFVVCGQDQAPVGMSGYHTEPSNNHLYSTVMKPHVNTVEQSKALLGSPQCSISPNYSSLLPNCGTTTNTTCTNSTANSKVNSSNSQPNISVANGLPPQPYPSSTLTYSGPGRSKPDQFANPYMRTSNQVPNGVAMSHYSNLEGNQDRLLSAGVYSAHQHCRYKTNSLGGGSSSSGVVSTGGSSPGHSPVGSMSGQAGTHV